MQEIKVLLEKKIIIVIVTIIILFVLPFIFLWEDSYIPIWDNLDGLFSQYIILSDSNYFFNFSGDAKVSQLGNGLSRSLFVSPSFVTSLLFFLFKPIVAYFLNFTFVHSIALIGSYLLIKEYIIKDQNLVALALSMCYMVTPIFTIYGATVAGVPIIIYSILNVINEKELKKSIMMIITFPVYSSFFLSCYYLVFFLLCVFSFELFLKKKFHGKLLFSFLLMLGGYAFVNHLIIDIIINNNVGELQRAEFNLDLSLNLKSRLDLFFNTFFHGRNHSSIYSIYIFLFSFFIFIHSIVFKNKLSNYFYYLLLLQFLLCLIYSFGSIFLNFVPLHEISIFKQFTFNRYTWYVAIIWVLIFSFSIKYLIDNYRSKIALTLSVIFFQIILSLYNNTSYRQNLFSLSKLNTLQDKIAYNRPQWTYSEFFSEKLFNKLKEHIDRPVDSYRVVSVGVYPSILQYNGFYTLDGYYSAYPLKYKQEFRKVICGELDKSPFLKEFFDFWGSQCYVFSSELYSKTNPYPYFENKEKNSRILNLSINTAQLKQMGCNYIISAVDIVNFKDLNLALLKTFENKQSPLKLYLYAVN